jgi:purine-binding chemotaxis protein CheW
VSNTQQFCTFFVDGQFFGVPVQQVQEVIRYQEMTRVPLVPRVIRGLINLRGQIVVAIDLRRRLNAAERPDDQLPMNVVVRTTDGVISLLVDEIGDVIEVQDDTFERPHDTLNHASRELVLGVHKLPQHLLLILDTGKVVNIAEGEDLQSKGEN